MNCIRCGQGEPVNEQRCEKCFALLEYGRAYRLANRDSINKGMRRRRELLREMQGLPPVVPRNRKSKEERTAPQGWSQYETEYELRRELNAVFRRMEGGQASLPKAEVARRWREKNPNYQRELRQRNKEKKKEKTKKKPLDPAENDFY